MPCPRINVDKGSRYRAFPHPQIAFLDLFNSSLDTLRLLHNKVGAGMKNTITISIEFYFKGEKHVPSLEVDLDAHVEANHGLEFFYPYLANSINIDLYSYEYEMMLAQDFRFSNAFGIAQEFLQGTTFDFIGFVAALKDSGINKAISNIAKEILLVDDLSAEPKLQKALLEAFKLGNTY